MEHYIERWMTPWTEEVICACEEALRTRNDNLEVGLLVVHGFHKTIGKLVAIKEDFVKVDERVQVGDIMTWVEMIWPRKLTYASSIMSNEKLQKE